MTANTTIRVALLSASMMTGAFAVTPAGAEVTAASIEDSGDSIVVTAVPRQHLWHKIEVVI